MKLELWRVMLPLALCAGALGCESGTSAASDGGTGTDPTADLSGSMSNPDQGGSGGLRPTGFPELPVPPTTSGRKVTVGNGKQYPKPCAALTAAMDGDTIEIDAGTYTADTCRFTANNLVIRGVGGRAVLSIDGVKPSGCKGLWVIGGKDVLIEDVEFSGAHLRPTDTFVQNGGCSADKNGAGIRWEGGNLTLRRCSFHDNDNGILGGSDPTSALLIEHSEFRSNSFDGYSHNLYINAIGQLTFRYSYSSRTTAEGHLLKSRAKRNIILYSRLTGEGSTSSYEINLPNGGESYVIGNVVQQSNSTGNRGMLDYASEGLSSGYDARVFVVNNTFVSERTAGATFLQLSTSASTQSRAINNLFIGTGTLVSGPTIMQSGNLTQDPLFVDSATYDYHVKAGSPAIGAGMDPGQVTVDGKSVPLAPVNQYVHTASGEPRPVGAKLDVGAFQRAQ